VAAASPSLPDHRSIYLDHHATTPLDERVLEAMMPYLREEFGNAASHTHAYGWRAEAAVDAARERLAELIGAAEPGEIVFTSGATESNNLAILGLAETQSSRRHLVTVRSEHPSVLDPCRALARRGFECTELEVDGEGMVAPDLLESALRDDTFLVSVMMANNEIGVIQPVAEIAALCRDRGVAFHTDAAQAAGKLELDVERDGLDLVSRPRLAPRQLGGGHEGGLRSGTLPVALIVGFARALELCLADRTREAERLVSLREGLLVGLREALPGRVILNGDAERRLPGNLNVSFEGVDGDRLLSDLRGIAVSSGSACSSARPEPSHVLLALGRSPALARASLRFGLGRSNGPREIEIAAQVVIDCVRAQDSEMKARGG
jgi:cysteine desulfurase